MFNDYLFYSTLTSPVTELYLPLIVLLLLFEHMHLNSSFEFSFLILFIIFFNVSWKVLILNGKHILLLNPQLESLIDSHQHI